MKTNSLLNQTIMLGNRAAVLALLTLLCALPAAVRADFGGSDSMSSGSSNWTSFSQKGDGRILFQNNRAEFVVGTPVTGKNQEIRKWNLNTGSYTGSWTVQVNVCLYSLPFPLTGGNWVNLGLAIAKTSDPTDVFNVLIEQELDKSNFRSGFITQDPSTYLSVKCSVAYAVLKISFDSVSKTLTSAYSSADTGYKWKSLQTVKLNSGTSNWGMTDSDTFTVALLGTSGNDSGTALPVNSGDAYFTDFKIITTPLANVDYQCDFGSQTPVWDLSGHYSGDVGHGLLLDFSITEVASGKFTGTGTLHSDDGDGNVMDAPLSVSGAVKGAGFNSPTLVSLTALATSGSGTLVSQPSMEIHNMTFTGAINITGEIDGSDRILLIVGGSAIAKQTDLLTHKKINKTAKLDTLEMLNLPADVTGHWGLDLNLIPAGNKFSGTSFVQTSTGGKLDLSPIGSYASATNSSKLTLKGGGCSLSLVITTSGSNMTLLSAKGKLFGQTVNYLSE